MTIENELYSVVEKAKKYDNLVSMQGNVGVDSIFCSFCGNLQDMETRVVAGINAYICKKCVEICGDIMSGDWETNPDNIEFNLDRNE